MYKRQAPGPAVQAEPIPTTNPQAQVTKMAFAWSKDQTPSNYYYYSGHPLSTSALLRLGGGSGRRFGSCLGHPECGHSVAMGTGRGSLGSTRYTQANQGTKKGPTLQTLFSKETGDPPVRPVAPGGARWCPVQRCKPSRFRPPTLTRRSPRWHSLGQRTKLPQTTTTTLGTPCLPRLYSGSGEAPGDDLGAVWGTQSVAIV